jgi:hypothetical protein
LKDKLLHLYDAERDKARYQVRDLDRLVRKHVKKSLHTLSDWKTYVRKFTVIAQWLKAEQVIQDEDYRTSFWLGIPEDMRNKVETHLLAGNTTKKVTEPFTVNEVSTIVEWLLHRNRFDRKRQHLKYKYEASDSESNRSTSSDTNPNPDSGDSNSEESESEHETKRHKVHRASRKEKPTTKKSTKTSSSSSPSQTKDKPNGNKKAPTEINSLIEQMSKLSLTDLNYAKAYFKALTLNPLMSQAVAKPQRADTFNQQQTAPTTTTMERPPTEILQRATTNITRAPLRSTPPFNCFGCRSHVHSLKDCIPLHELISQGQLGRNSNQRICLPSGAPLRHQQGETLLDAYHQLVGNRRSEDRAAANLTSTYHDRYQRGQVNYVVVTMSD